MVIAKALEGGSGFHNKFKCTEVINMTLHCIKYYWF